MTKIAEKILVSKPKAQLRGDAYATIISEYSTIIFRITYNYHHE
jgi:hypothetical protein